MELENGTLSKRQIKTNFTQTQLYKLALIILTATVKENSNSKESTHLIRIRVIRIMIN